MGEKLFLRHIYNIVLFYFLSCFVIKKGKKLKTKTFMMFLNPKKMYSKVAKRAGNVAKILPKLAGNFNELATLVLRGAETEVNVAFKLPGHSK
jgi:hypothetical protein